MMGPGAMVLLAILIVGTLSLLVFLCVVEKQKPSTTTKSTKCSERYDKIWTEVMAKDVKTLNVLVASGSRGGGKSFMAAYQQGYQKGHQNGYREGVDHAIQELCDADGDLA